MAYGYARGRSPEPDPRDVVAEAARAAGLTVEQWLARAAEENDDGRTRRFRPKGRRAARDLDDRRYSEPPRREPRYDGLSEERVARILDDALNSMQDTIRANEERTFEALDALGRKLDAGPEARQPRQPRGARAAIAEAERRFDRAPEATDPEGEPRHEPALTRRLEERISNVVDLLEQRARADERRAAPAAQPTDLRPRNRALEKQVAALNERIEALANAVTERPDRRQPRGVDASFDRLQQEFGHRPGAMPAAPESERLLESLRALDSKISQLARPAPDSRIDRLTSELAALRANLGRPPQPDPGLAAIERHFETLGARLDAMAERIATLKPVGTRDLRARQSADAALEALRRQIQQSMAPADDGRVIEAMQALERRVEALGQPPEALAETFDRVQSIDRKLDTMQRTPPEIAARLDQLDRIESLERKLDGLRGLMGERQPGDGRMPGLELALESLSARLEELQRGTPAPHAIDRLHAEIQALGRKLEDSPRRDSPPSADPETAERIRGLEAKLEAKLDAQLDALQSAPAALAARLDQIHEMMRSRAQAPAAPPLDLERLGGLEAKLEAKLDAKLDALKAAPVELAARLDRIQAMMQAQPAAAMPTGVETLLRNLSLRLEAMQTSNADDMALDRLHDDIRAISRKLEAGPARMAPGVAEIGNLERSISELFGQIGQLRDEVGGAAEEAARRAADDVLRNASIATPAPADDAVLRQLDDIHAAQQDADRRANATLSAVHETLTRVVERLVDLEQDIKAKPAPAPTAAAPAPAAAPMAAPAAFSPVMAAPVTTTPLPPLGAPAEPAMPRAQTVASLRAERLGVSASAAAAAPKQGLGQMLAAARGAVTNLKPGKSAAGKTATTMAPAPEAEAAEPALTAPPPRPAMETASLDLPLEPGSGRPRPGMQGSGAADAHDPKAQFLAAARRAAQAAAEQSAEALAPAPAKGKSLARRTLSKKQVILLGLAALVVAVGATLQIAKAPPPRPEAQPDRVSNLDRLFGAKPQAERSQVAQGQTQAPTPPAREATAQPRQILPPAAEAQPQREAGLTAAKPDDRVQSQPPRAAQAGGAFLPADPSTVGSLGAEASRPAPTAQQPLPPPADPLLSFEGVTGAERLKAAARAGDASAFVELGNRYLEGRGAPRDARIAAQWFERAAAAGSAPAQFRLGAIYREGRGVERNARTALKHFLSAAENGNARAMYNAAVLLAEGVNGSPDYGQAGEWFRKAAEFGIRDSQYNLAILHARGLGVPQDLVTSYAWFAAAAQGGDEDAAKKRDEVAARLSADKLTQAKAAAQAWKAKTPDPAANEVSVPPGGWDAAGQKQVPAAALPKSEKRV
jgi:localization factor PodJL